MPKPWLPLLVLAVGCADEGTDLVVRGTIEHVNVPAPFVGGAQKAMRTIDTVVAFPMEKATIAASGIDEVTTARLGALGQFSLSLRRDRDYLLVLIDSTQTGVERFVGYVAASVAGGESTLLIPASAATAGTVEMGTVSGTSGERTSTTALDPALMSLTPETLLNLARSDAALVNLRNLLVNWSPTTRAFYQGSLQLHFETQSGGMAARTPENVQPDANAYTALDGWSVQIDTNAPEATIDAYCAPNPTSFRVALPDASSVSNAGSTCTTDPATGLRAASVPGGLMAIEKRDQGNLASHLSISFPRSAATVPAGDFVLEVGGVARARFDFDMVRPWHPTSRRPTMVVPTLRANTDASHRVTSFTLAWFAPDGAGALAPMTDLTLLQHISPYLEVKFADADGNLLEYATVNDTTTTTTLVPTTTMYVSGGDPTRHLHAATVFVQNAGVSAFLSAYYE